MNKTTGNGPFSKPEGYSEGLHYLWHLDMIGLLRSPYWLRPGEKLDGAPDGWEQVRDTSKAQPVKIAIIDNGMARDHPNLDAGRCDDRIEFVQSPSGTRYVQREKDDEGEECAPDADKAAQPEGGSSEAAQSASGADNGGDPERASGPPGKFPINPVEGRNIGELLKNPDVTNLIAGNGSRIGSELFKVLEDIRAGGTWYADVLETPVQDPSHRFGAHGTACAGLVAASATTDRNNPNPHAIRYSGASPLSKIIPITTSYTAEYWPLIMALLYAWVRGADVILLPLSVEEMRAPMKLCPEGATPQPFDEELIDAPNATDDPRFSRLMVSRTRLAEKELFEALLRVISSLVPVIVPAGNSGPRGLEYPATIPGLIVVGACTAYGHVASYSSRPSDGRHDGITVYAPSDDREEVSEQEFRVAASGRRDLRLPSPQLPKGPDGNEQMPNLYCPYGVLTTDIPGYWGYTTMDGPVRDLYAPAGSTDARKPLLEQPQNQPAALYTVFGGTSAAASIVAGVVGQILAWAKASDKPLTGHEIRDLLVKTATRPPVMGPECAGEAGDGEAGEEGVPFLDARKAIEHAARVGPDS